MLNIKLQLNVAGLFILYLNSRALTQLQLTIVGEGSNTIITASTLYAIALLAELRYLMLRIDCLGSDGSIEAVDSETIFLG